MASNFVAMQVIRLADVYGLVMESDITDLDTVGLVVAWETANSA